MRTLLILFLALFSAEAQLNVGSPFFVAAVMHPSTSDPCASRPAIAFTARGSIDDTGNGTEYVSGSFTPTAGSVLLAAFNTSDTVNPDEHAITSLHGNWTKVNSVLFNTTGTGLNRLSMWYCTNASATASAVTNKFAGAATGCEARIVEFASITNKGTAIIVQSVTNSGDAGSSSLTLAALQGGGTNAVFAAFGNDLNPFNATNETGWVEDWDDGYSTPSTGLNTTYRLATTDNTITVTNVSDWAGIAVEIAAMPCNSAGGPDVWYDISATSDALAGGDPTTADSEDVVVGASGTATKTRIYVDFGSATNVKMALYDGSNNLLANGTGTTSASGYLEVTFGTPVAVSAATYRLAWEFAGTGSGVAYLATSGSTYRYHSLAYASFPENPLSAGSSFGTRTFRCSLYVD